MRPTRAVALACAVLFWTPGALQAQGFVDPPPPARPASGEPATGLLVQGLLSTSIATFADATVLDLGGGFVPAPQTNGGIRVGFRLGALTLALTAQLGIQRSRVADPDDEMFRMEDVARITVLTVAPTVMLELWNAADGRVRTGVLGQVGLGWYRLRADSNEDGELVDRLDVDAFLIPFVLAFYGDLYAHRNFGVGVELGFEGFPSVGGKVSVESDGEDARDVGDVNTDRYGLYGALRLTVIVGD